MATTAIFANPGQTVRLAVQVTDGYGSRVDGYVPQVDSVYFPDLSKSTGYPLAMSRIETGLYVHGLVLPADTASLGTFIVSVLSTNPATGGLAWEIFSIHVARPFGNSSVAPA